MPEDISARVFAYMREIIIGGLAERLDDPTYKILAPHEGFLIDVIAAHEPISMKELSKATGTLPNTMTGVVDRLVRRGILERESSPEDRRVVLVRLTEHGAALHAKAQKFFLDYASRLLSSLNDEEKKVLLVFLERVQNRLSS